MFLIVRNSIFAKGWLSGLQFKGNGIAYVIHYKPVIAHHPCLLFMIETFMQISAIVQKLHGKPMDSIRSYLAMTEILKILADNKIIHFTNYLHLQWRCDYKVMCATLTGVSRGTMIQSIAENYNRSIPAVERVLYKK